MFRIKTDIRQYKCESPDKVEKLIRNWVIRPTDLIFSHESADWSPIGDHPEFTPLFELLNEQLRNEPDTIVTRAPSFAPPTAPEGVEINRADSDEITTMTRRTLALHADPDDETIDFAAPESIPPQDNEPPRKIGRHDLPEELFATAEIQGTFSRDDTAPPLDELAELSELEKQLKQDGEDEPTMIVEYEPPGEDEPTMIVEIDPEKTTDELEAGNISETTLKDEEAANPNELTKTVESTAFARAATWEALNAPIPDENDDDLILAQDLSNTLEVDTAQKADPPQLEEGETQEFIALKTPDTHETADFTVPETLIAASDDKKPTEKTEEPQDSEESEETTDSTVTEDSETAEQSEQEQEQEVSETETPDEDLAQDEEPEIPEGYTVQLPPIGPSDEDIALGILRATTTEAEKEEAFHTPNPQQLNLIVRETFYLAAPSAPATKAEATPATDDSKTPDTNPKNNKTATYLMAAVVLIIVVIIIAAFAT